MARRATQMQEGTLASLRAKHDGGVGKVAHQRTTWDGKTLCVGFGLEEDPQTGVSSTFMYRIEPDGSFRGV